MGDLEVDTGVAKTCFDGTTGYHTIGTASTKASQSILIIRYAEQSQSNQESEILGAPSRHPTLEGLHITQGGWGARGELRVGLVTKGVSKFVAIC